MSEERDRLARAYVERQELDEERAAALADEVAGDSEVLAAALRWVDDGVFDDAPQREGFSPRTLSEVMSPSGIFGTLVRLRTRREQTLTFLRRDRASLMHRPR